MRIKNEYRETTVIHKSRFLVCLYTVRSEDAAKAYIADIRKEFPDASHVCTAYVIGENLKRSSDNGEPAGTAGMPMLEAILNSDVEDICACTVRWFGGIKLGTGGLVRAYGGCTAAAIRNAPKVIDVPMDEWSITYPYELTGQIEGWLRKNTTIISQDYGEAVSAIVQTENKELKETLRNLSHGTVEPVYLKTVFCEKDISF